MANKMLIDATHPEETRVVVLRGNRVEEFDFESAHRKQLRGNIYLAKVTRVEPSLQAAFVDYGGNRHGFLAFSEIHPDYYQIPVADRQALLAQEESEQREHEEEQERRGRRRRHRQRGAFRNRDRDAVRSEPVGGETPTADSPAGEESAVAAESAVAPERDEIAPSSEQPQAEQPSAPDAAPSAEAAAEPAASIGDIAASLPELPVAEISEPAPMEHPDPIEAGVAPVAESGEASPPNLAAEAVEGEPVEARAEEGGSSDEDEEEDDQAEEEVVESVGGADALEEVQERIPRFRRQYKIQEVIKRRQVMLVQVVKEERG